MNLKKNTKYFVLVAAVMIILAIVGKRAGWFGKDPEINVAAEKAELRTIVETITANGKVRPQTEVKISPDVSGEIVELHVAEGDQVESGQLLLKIKPDTYISIRDRVMASVNSSRAQLANSKARLAQVNAQFELAERNYNRNLKLFDQQTISESEYENVRSNFMVARAEVEAASQSVQSAEYSVKSAMASLEEAEENLNRTIIFSPMTGTVSRLGVEQGERVVGTAQMAGTEMMRIANLNRMEVLVEVNENDIVRVKNNDTALIEVDAYMGETFKGVVTEIANSARTANIGTDQITNFEVKILILPETYSHLLPDTPAGRFPFLPGMSATVDIQTRSKADVIAIPIQSVTTRSDSLVTASAGNALPEPEADISDRSSGGGTNEVVFLIGEDNQVVLTRVETGIQDNNYIEIVSGIEVGDEVVSAPYSAITRILNHGSRVKVVGRQELFN